MSIRCRCQRCSIRGLMGPAVLITIGVLFLLQQTSGWHWGFERTWPVILLVIGGLKLAESLASTDGHNATPPGGAPPPQAPGPGQQPPPPPLA
jgi:hypothetical protein